MVCQQRANNSSDAKQSGSRDDSTRTSVVDSAGMTLSEFWMHVQRKALEISEGA